MGRRPGGDPLRWPAIVPRRNRGASGGRGTDGSQAEAAPAAAADTATGQPPMAKRLWTNPAEKEDSTIKKRAVEIAERWKAWKSKGRITPLPTVAWKSRKQREIPTFPQLRRKQADEKWKTKSRFPTFPPPRIPFLPEPNPGRGRASPSASASRRPKSQE
jgi:hypothetical protein